MIGSRGDTGGGTGVKLCGSERQAGELCAGAAGVTQVRTDGGLLGSGRAQVGTQTFEAIDEPS